MLQKLPAGVRQSGDEGSALRFGKTFDRVHEMDVRAAPFQKIDEVFAQSFVVVARTCLFPGYRLFLGRWLCFFLHDGDSYFSETRTCCGISGTGRKVVFANPAL